MKQNVDKLAKDGHGVINIKQNKLTINGTFLAEEDITNKIVHLQVYE